MPVDMWIPLHEDDEVQLSIDVPRPVPQVWPWPKTMRKNVSKISALI